MDHQDAWALGAAILGGALGVVGWMAVRRGRTSLGWDPRSGGLAEFGAGCLFSIPFFVVLLVVSVGTGLCDAGSWSAPGAGVIGIWVYFLVLFLVEETVFRSWLMTGLGVLTGQLVALLGTAVLVAAAYVFADHSGVLPVVGAVITNTLTGLARWRTGRIWWGLGQRWVWNSATVTFGFFDSAYSLDHPVLHLHLLGPTWLTGGQFGQEGGLVGIAFQLVMIAAVARWATGRQGPWTVEEQETRAPVHA